MASHGDAINESVDWGPGHVDFKGTLITVLGCQGEFGTCCFWELRRFFWMLYAKGVRLHNWLDQGRRRVVNLGEALHDGLLCSLVPPASATSHKGCDISSLPK